jgi:hypothetical protein
VVEVDGSIEIPLQVDGISRIVVQGIVMCDLVVTIDIVVAIGTKIMVEFFYFSLII